MDGGGGDEDDGVLCLVCYLPFESSGEHRASCLACGHIFGKSCIVRWLASSPTCPNCNSVALQDDIRILYTRKIQSIDTSDRDRAIRELEQASQSQ